jgi:hypothetical protein
MIFNSVVWFYYMPGKKKKKTEQPIFDSIRKPTAPPSRQFGQEKPDDKAVPSGRKKKHKKKEDFSD